MIVTNTAMIENQNESKFYYKNKGRVRIRTSDLQRENIYWKLIFTMRVGDIISELPRRIVGPAVG